MPARALVFSPDANAAGLLEKALGDADFTVECCTEAAGALESLNGRKYTVVVVDARDYRERDGILRHIRFTPLNKDCLAIAVLNTQGHAPVVFSLGANLLLYRPLTADRVQSSVKAATRLLQRDKRTAKRARVHADANLSSPAAENERATLLDLSNDGLSLQCDRALPAQSKIYLRFTLPGQTKSIQLSGETMWQDARGRVGIRFVDVPQSARKLLKEWLECKLSISESKVRVELPGRHPVRLTDSPGDRRTESRHACRLGAEVYKAGIKVPYRCTLTDISVGGFYVEMTEPFPVGTTVEVVVRTEDSKFVSVGTVQKMDRGFGMGVAFATQTPVQRAQVQELIKIAYREREAEGDPALKF